MDVKSTCIPTWHQMNHVTWSLGLVSKTHLLEVGLTQYHETMALLTLITIDLFYFIMCKEVIKIALVEGPVTCDFTLQTWYSARLVVVRGKWPIYDIFSP